jgi:hypothetical protein
MKKKRPPRKKRTAAEKLLDAARRSPSPKVSDPRQLDLIDYVVDRRKRDAFAVLDAAIDEALGKGAQR